MKIKPGKDPGGVAIELGMNEASLPGAEQAKTPVIFRLKRILVPVDFSEGSNKALQYAMAFARQFEAELTLLHVVQRYPQVPELAPVTFEPVEDLQQKLEVLAEDIRPHAFVSTVARVGDPALEIVAVAKEMDMDLIILSTHGRTGLSHLLMGSTAEKIVRRAKCPVLIVRAHEHEFISEPQPESS